MDWYTSLPTWLREILPIVVLLTVVAFVIARLPRTEVSHSPAFRRRRLMNWLPLGLTYAFLYMGRYNLKITLPPSLILKLALPPLTPITPAVPGRLN